MIEFQAISTKEAFERELRKPERLWLQFDALASAVEGLGKDDYIEVKHEDVNGIYQIEHVGKKRLSLGFEVRQIQCSAQLSTTPKSQTHK